MSILISAPIRTGKTLKVIQCIFEELNKGRMVYTNIIGIKIAGVISVTSSIDDPFDWRDLPNGSVLVWDEAHEHPAYSDKDLLKDFKIDQTAYLAEIAQIEATPKSVTEKKRLIDLVEKRIKEQTNKRKTQIRDIGEALLMHGHFGVEIYFITQRPSKLNQDVLASVTTHLVMRRKFGMDAALIWEFGEAMTTWSKSTADIALNKTLWRYPKHLYNFYISSESHQVRKSFPAKYYAFLLLPFLLIGYGFYKAKQTGFFGILGDKEKPTMEANLKPDSQPQNLTKKEPSTMSVSDAEQLNNDESKRVASIFDSSSGCRAYSGTGELLSISEDYCKYLSDHPARLIGASTQVKDERLQAINYTQYGQNTQQTFTAQQ